MKRYVNKKKIRTEKPHPKLTSTPSFGWCMVDKCNHVLLDLLRLDEDCKSRCWDVNNLFLELSKSPSLRFRRKTIARSGITGLAHSGPPFNCSSAARGQSGLSFYRACSSSHWSCIWSGHRRTPWASLRNTYLLGAHQRLSNRDIVMLSPLPFYNHIPFSASVYIFIVMLFELYRQPGPPSG